MKVALVTIGTRGDVQPYIAVARALMARGHEVKVAVGEEHGPLLAAYGVPHHPLGPNFREVLRSDLGRAWLTSGDSPRRYARYARELFQPMQRALCEAVEEAVEGVDAVAFYVLAAYAMHATERRGLPMVALSPWAAVPSSEIPPLPALARAPGFLRRLAAHLVLRVGFSSLNEEHQRYRSRAGLPRWRAGDIVHAVLDAEVPTVSLFSEAVLPRPKDWGARHHVAGYAFAPRLPYSPPRALADFLAAGAAPIYMGFGSMTGRDPGELGDLATRAARAAGVRAVIATGWAGLDVAARDDVYVVDEIPHDWLFPRVSAVVHHGGAGTFAEGLRAGRPTVVAAFFGDQPFWGWLNERNGTRPPALMRRRLDAPTLAATIRRALDGGYAGRAREIAARIAAEDGAARAAELIEAVCGARARR